MPVAFEDCYATLGVARDANAQEISKLARTHHPDVSKDPSTAENTFKEINAAYEVLGDPEKRTKYDRLGANGGGSGPGSWAASGEHGDGTEQEFQFGGTGFSDFFERYFSGGSRYGFPPEDRSGAGEAHTRRHYPCPNRGANIEGDIVVTLSEALHGTLRPISMQRLNRETGQAETRIFQVRIPPGATDGRRIRLPGQGEPGQGGGPPGDLYLRVRHASHPDFSSRGADIFHELDIAPWEAVLAAEIVVPTLDGSIKLRTLSRTENRQKLRGSQPRRVEHLRTTCGMHDTTLKFMLDLLHDVECLREERRQMLR